MGKAQKDTQERKEKIGSPGLELKRKFTHLLVGLIIVILVYFRLLDGYILFLLGFVGYLAFYFAYKKIDRFREFMLRHLERPGVEIPAKGAMFYLLGSSLTLILFEPSVAMAAILILAIGDSVPSMISIYSRYLKNPFADRKYLEGVLIGFLFAFWSTLLFVSWFEGLLATLVSMTLEVYGVRIKGKKIDDNLIIPFVAGAVIWLLRIVQLNFQ